VILPKQELLGLEGQSDAFNLDFTHRGVEREIKNYCHWEIEEATYDQIAEIDVAYSDNWLDDSLITITRTDGSQFFLLVSNAEHKDKTFYQRLLKQWKARDEPNEQ